MCSLQWKDAGLQLEQAPSQPSLPYLSLLQISRNVAKQGRPPTQIDPFPRLSKGVSPTPASCQCGCGCNRVSASQAKGKGGVHGVEGTSYEWLPPAGLKTLLYGQLQRCLPTAPLSSGRSQWYFLSGTQAVCHQHTVCRGGTGPPAERRANTCAPSERRRHALCIYNLARSHSQSCSSARGSCVTLRSASHTLVCHPPLPCRLFSPFFAS